MNGAEFGSAGKVTWPSNFINRSIQLSVCARAQQMHDEVSETENIRQNLAIERMIIGGCDILLDVNQGESSQAKSAPQPTRQAAN